MIDWLFDLHPENCFQHIHREMVKMTEQGYCQAGMLQVGHKLTVTSYVINIRPYN